MTVVHEIRRLRALYTETQSYRRPHIALSDEACPLHMFSRRSSKHRSNSSFPRTIKIGLHKTNVICSFVPVWTLISHRRANNTDWTIQKAGYWEYIDQIRDEVKGN
jgi:hypothetical protein